MTDAEKQQLNAIIAEALDDKGLGQWAWGVALTCPQGHSNIEPECGGPNQGIGEVCWECANEDTDGWVNIVEELQDDPNWRPEWRIGRVPRDFTQPQVLWPVLEIYMGLCPGKIRWELERVGHHWTARYTEGCPEIQHGWVKPGQTITEAMARVFHFMLTMPQEGEVTDGDGDNLDN